MDVFVFVNEASVNCTVDKEKCLISFRYADKIPVERVEFSVGGNAANTAVTFSRLGFASALFSMVGDDNLGKQITDSLEKDKVDCRYIQQYSGPTSYTTALVYQGERTLLVHHVPHDYNLPDFDPVDWVYLTSMGKSYLMAYEKVLRYVKAHRPRVSFNPGTFQLRDGPNKLKPYFQVTDILFVNREEAMQLTEQPASASFLKLGQLLFDMGPKVVVITDGPRGAYCFDGRELLYCEAFPIEVVERTGAGDSYGSGFTSAILEGKSLEEAMLWGMANSTGAIKEVGPQKGLPKRSELLDLIAKYKHIKPRRVRN